MTLIALDDICEIQMGKTPSRSKPEYWGGTLPWVTISDISGGRVANDTKECITERGASESGSKLIPEGTLLFSFKLSIGKRAFAGCDLYTNEAIAALKIRDRSVIHDRFLYWALGAVNYDEMVDRAAKGKTLNKVKLKQIPIPLPPLAEQKRIAGILDAADALRAKRRESLAQLDALIQATFLDMFGDPVTNPKGLERTQLGDLLKVKSGEGLVAKDMDSTGRYPVYGGNGINGFHSEYRFDEPQIVLGRVGVYCGAVHLTSPQSWITDNALFVQKLFKPMNQEYLLAALREADLNQYANQAAQPLISGSRIYPVEVLLPPIEMQHRFAARVLAIKSLRMHMTAHSESLDDLFAALQARAFAGER